MSLPIPLTVALKATRGGKLITRQVRDLGFRWSLPGGFASGTVDLDRPLSLDPEELAYYGTLAFYDGRNGETVFEGRVEDLGRSAGGDGQTWRITAMGPSAHASDRTVPLVYVDRGMNQWALSRHNTRQDASANIDEDSSGVSGWRLQIPRGAVVTTTQRAAIYHRALADTDQTLARASVSWDTGVTDANWRVQLRTSTAGAASTNSVADAAANTAGGTLSGSYGSGITAGDVWAHLFFERQTSGVTVADDVTWAHLTSIVVRGLLKDASGTDITTGYTLNTVLASDVVTDLLGRLLPEYDGATADIDVTSHNIEQLAYPDGVTAAKVLQDLLVFHPDFYWAAWEKTHNGKHRFEFQQWSTTPRYEATIRDGFDSPGSAGELWNAVTVRGRDADGNIKTVQRTNTVAVLDDAGITRSTTIDLGDEVFTTANANRAGDQFLVEHEYPPNAGRLTIARPILDMQTGRMVSPWEIRPGLIRVRGVQPAGRDALNPEGRDGVTTFRVVGMDYRASNNTATLELDSRPRTVAQMLADATRTPLRRRR